MRLILPRTVFLLLAPVFLALVVVRVPQTYAADPAQSSRTKIKMLTPFGVKGLSEELQITDKVSGKCFAASAASSMRPDAWRCSAGNAILDPCYQRILGDEKQLACPVEGPWSQKVILLTITEPMPTEPRKKTPSETALPWALDLANGKRCSLFTGVTAPVAGMRINYGCPGGFQVVGDIDRSASTWRIFLQAENSSVLEQVDIAVAWY